MNLLDWVQVALSLVVMLTGLYIALLRRSRRRVLVTTRVGGFGVALLGLSYFVGGSRIPLLRVRCSTESKRTRRWWGSGDTRGAGLAGAQPVINSEDLRRSRPHIRLGRAPESRNAPCPQPATCC